MGVAVLVVANDFTALSVALPAIERDLHTNVATVQWVINGYAMVFGVLIVTGGRLADMFGRRRIFVTGATIFAGFSLIGGFAPNAVGAAGLPLPHGYWRRDDVARHSGHDLWSPATRESRTRRRGHSGRCGIRQRRRPTARRPAHRHHPDGDGSSSSIFLSPPAAILITMVVVPCDVTDKNHGGIDYSGTAVLSIGLLALLLALDWALDLGWTAPLIVFLFALAAVALVGFLVIERRAGESALVPATVMQNRAFLAAGIATLLASAIFFAALLYLPQFMAEECSASPLSAQAPDCCL